LYSRSQRTFSDYVTHAAIIHERTRKTLIRLFLRAELKLSSSVNLLHKHNFQRYDVVLALTKKKKKRSLSKACKMQPIKKLLIAYLWNVNLFYGLQASKAHAEIR